MSDLNELVQKTHNFYKSFQYQKSLENCLDAYQKFPEESIEKKRFLFNLAVLFTRVNKPEQAKNYLDKINDDSFIFPNLKDIALLYETLALLFINQNNNESNKFKKICECLEQSSIYYSKCKEWSSYCINEIERAKILLDNNYEKESYLIADKILTVTLYLDESKTETIKILNNLAILYAKDSRQKSNLKASFKLFRKVLNLSEKYRELNFIINSNYLGILNQLYIKRNKNIGKQKNADISKHEDEAEIYFYFNLGYSKFICEKYDEALDSFNQALNLVENKSLDRDRQVKREILESISVCHFKLGNYVEAKKNLELALKDSSDDQVKKRLNSKKNLLETKFNVLTKNETEEKVDKEMKTKEEVDDEKNNENNSEDGFKKENEEKQVEEEKNKVKMEEIIKKKTENFVKSWEASSSIDETNKTTNDNNQVLSDSETNKNNTKIYNDFNNGTAFNHPEDREIQETKSSRICSIM
ncbi:unnamed protein product [Brachionus calyciflorus]|uniref:Uncharacterized protein n=1 Tax=Brachionus calyciflorus TaxID=104777 RepID=A0A814J014_9BILA|nr:unnamed protein product [Brachionus calyciflorus]